MPKKSKAGFLRRRRKSCSDDDARTSIPSVSLSPQMLVAVVLLVLLLLADAP